MVRELSILRKVVWVGSTGFMVFELLALLSTLGRELAIAWAVWQLLVRPADLAPSAKALGCYWGLALGVAATLLIHWVVFTKPHLLSIGIGTISAIVLGLLITSIYSRYRHAHGHAV